MRPMSLLPILRCLLIACLLPTAAPAAAATGIVQLQVHEPTTDTRMPAMLFYPSPARGAPTRIGPYVVDASFGLPRQTGPHPLVLISHGHGGSALGHHPLAVALAEAGFLVAAIEHAGDSHLDQSGFGTERVLLGRAWQVSSLLDTLLADPEWAALIDPHRIGVAGFSAGGHTALALLGAEPDPAHRLRYCQQHPQDEELCLQAPADAPALEQRRPLQDSRVRAAFLMAPLAVFYDAQALAQVQRPVFLHAAMADDVLLPRWNALAVRDGVAALRDWRAVVGAGHYVYLAPCPPPLATALPTLCSDPPGVDRRRVQAQLAGEAIDFFQQTLRR